MRIMMITALFFTATTQVFAGSCLLTNPEGFETQEYVAEKDIVISLEELRNKYHWNRKKILWKWSEKRAGTKFSNGSIMFLSDSTTDPKWGVPFTFGSDGTTIGEICVGNLQFSGAVQLPTEGIRLMEGTTMIYPE